MSDVPFLLTVMGRIDDAHRRRVRLRLVARARSAVAALDQRFPSAAAPGMLDTVPKEPEFVVSRHRAWVVLVLLTFAGCVDREVIDGGVVVTFAWWVKGGAIAGCAVALVLGLMLRWSRWRLVCLVFGILGPSVLLPSLWQDSVRITKLGIRRQSGMWFAPNITEVSFADANLVALPQPDVLGKRRRKITVQLRSGAAVHFAQGDLMTQCIEDIASAAKAADVRVVRVD